MDDIARYEEAYTTLDIDIRIVRNANSVEKALQYAEMVRRHKNGSVNVNDDVERRLISEIFISKEDQP